MADAYFRAGSPDLARDFLAQAVNVSDDAPAPSLRYARVLLADGNDRVAEDILLAALRREPAQDELLALLGEIYLERDAFGRAEAVADQLRRAGTEPARAAANRLQTQLVAQRDGSAQAIALLEEMAQGGAAGLGEQVTLLRARLATGETEEALKLAEDMAADAPDDLDRRFLLGVTRAATGDLDSARADMRAIVTDAPARVPAWQQLYRMTGIAEGPAAASAVLESALEANPAAPVLLWMRAAELEQAGDIDAAIAVYEDLYARDSSSTIFANNLASLLVTYKEDTASLDRAWTIARRLRDTQVPAFQDTYGWLAFRRGEADVALPYLENAARGLPQDPIVQFHLAQVYAALDQPQEAIAAYRRVLDVAGPADSRPQIARAQDELDRLLAVAPQPENQ
jgi:predicted Zn-dependent protease